MAGTSLFLLLDDIASVLDDVALMTKVAAKKTAGVLGDDLALNAQQVSGVASERELPVVWAVAKGSLVNKLILVPAAVALSAFAPWGVGPLLMLGGFYLCFEGVEKLAHKLLHRHPAAAAPLAAGPGAGVEPGTPPFSPPGDAAVPAPAGDAGAHAPSEAGKIRGAIRTDFVLSAEIIVISLGTVAQAPFLTRVAVLCAVGLLMTVGVYGLVAGIVKLDDAGLFLAARPGAGVMTRATRNLGRALVGGTPWLMRGLSVAGTVAMFLVGGGILVHELPWLHGLLERAARGAEGALPGGPALAALLTQPLNAVVGVAAGALVLGVLQGAKRLTRRA